MANSIKPDPNQSNATDSRVKIRVFMMSYFALNMSKFSFDLLHVYAQLPLKVNEVTRIWQNYINGRPSKSAGCGLFSGDPLLRIQLGCSLPYFQMNLGKTLVVLHHTPQSATRRNSLTAFYKYLFQISVNGVVILVL